MSTAPSPSGAALLLLLLGVATAGRHGLASVALGPGGSISYETISGLGPFCLVSALLTAAAPWVALRRPVIGLLLASVLPLWLLGIHQMWAFTSLVGVLAVAVITLARSPVTAGAMALGSMVFPLALVGHTTMSMPDGAEIYLHFGGRAPAGFVVTEAFYGVGMALVMVGGWMLRRYVAAGVRVARDTAALAERARLARDLHDVVAHHVSLIAVRAETAPYTVRDLSDGARTAFGLIADDSRRALDELRGVLGVLRRADGSVDLAPQPTGSDVAVLVAEASAAGTVTYAGDEHLVALGDATGHVAYRVVQEALTNARRHAAGAPVRITATPDPDGLVLRVANPVAAGTTVLPGAGLAGMRERVEAVGGAFTAEVTDGELVVEAVLPR